MKILWISQNLPFPPKTGVLQRNYNLIREAAQFADIHLVAILKKDILPNYDACTRGAGTAQALSPCGSGAATHRDLAPGIAVGADQEPVHARSVHGQLGRIRWAAQRCCERSSAPSNTISSISTPSASRVTDRSRRKSARVLNHHNIESHLFERRIPYERNSLKRAYIAMEARKLRRYEETCAREFDLHVMVSELDCDPFQGNRAVGAHRRGRQRRRRDLFPVRRVGAPNPAT